MHHNNMPPACWNEPPQHHYLTHSRASGNQREGFELHAESLAQHLPPMAATILNSPSLLSSSLLRCMTLLTMRYSFRLSWSRSKAVRFLSKRVPSINSYSNFGFCGPLLSCSAGVRHPDAPALARPLPLVVKEEQVIPLVLGVNFSLTFLSVNLFPLSLSLLSTESLSGDGGGGGFREETAVRRAG